jgi:myo-inositol 2-dehydrogenase/D-chiro-inositol 1-dehydrogenase/scyllo-inositol 2-dehydrogenase (NAD+)
MFATVKFESGGLASISGVCPCDYGYDARMEIIGKKGIMIVGELKGYAVTVGIDRDQGLVTPIFQRWPQRFANAYINEIEHFIESIKNDTTPKVGGEDGRWAVAGVLAGTRSFLEVRPVQLSEVM